ncbi:MAG: hypothetical protein NPIRA02_30960 [Nitrospirales bacterium]|nr:MAG: hypothetical protein NPIRA02_30960 [Nitrospirales bacterium]
MTSFVSSLASPPLSPLLRLRSTYYRCWYEISRGFTWIRREYHEQPARALPETLTPYQRHRIKTLQLTYGVHFEDQLHISTTLENYEYLDLLDQTKEKLGWEPDRNKELVDVGSLNFYYAPALHAFFHPHTLQGIELEGYRVYTNFYSRFDYAQCYIRPFANTSYTVMDFCNFTGSADGITCFYPFVKPEPLVAWRLPLKVFQPQRMFERMAHSLRPEGFVLMMNHGEDEAQWACTFAQQNGLQLKSQPQPIPPLFPRADVPIISVWNRA